MRGRTPGGVLPPGLGALALAACLLASCAPSTAPPAAGGASAALDALVDRVLAAHGGREALAKVKAYRMEGTLTSTMRGTGPFTRTFERPSRLRVQLDYPNHPETRILDGERGWRSDGKGGLAPAEGFLLGSMQVQAARANLPWLLDERRRDAKLLPPAADGKRQGIEIAVGPGLTLTAFAELATGRIVRVESAIDLPGMQTGFATEYGDFRSVAGVLFPFREGNAASGSSTGDTAVTAVVVNPPPAEGTFRP